MNNLDKTAEFITECFKATGWLIPQSMMIFLRMIKTFLAISFLMAVLFIIALFALHGSHSGLLSGLYTPVFLVILAISGISVQVKATMLAGGVNYPADAVQILRTFLAEAVHAGLVIIGFSVVVMPIRILL